VITTGEGGMIAVHDPQVADRLRKLRQHAMDVSDVARHGARDVVIEGYPERGWNCRMTDMQAALGLCQLDLLDEILAERGRLADRYAAAFDGDPIITAPRDPAYAQRTWQSYAVHVSARSPVTRNDLMRLLVHDGIATRRGVMAIHREPSYAGWQGTLPNTELVSDTTMMLPLFPGLTDEQQDYVIERLRTHVSALVA
jgi:perosamine synthetase